MGPFVLHSLMGIEGNGLFINLFFFFFTFAKISFGFF